MDNGRVANVAPTVPPSRRPANLPGVHPRAPHPHQGLMRTGPPHVTANNYVAEPSSTSSAPRGEGGQDPAVSHVTCAAPSVPVRRGDHGLHQHHHHPGQQQQQQQQHRTLHNLAHSKPLDVDACLLSNGLLDGHIVHPVITRQPCRGGSVGRDKTTSSHLSSSKDVKSVLATPASQSCSLSAKATSSSITCSHCHRCRCQACVSGARRLPRAWLCGRRCECSAERAVEVCSCLIAVRCLFYHCVDDDDDNMRDSGGATAADDPCSCCERPHCCLRWSAMGALSLCLPCLCLYWPLRGLLAASQATYSLCCHRRGCRCQPQPGTKLLLDPESSSAWNHDGRC